MHASCFSLLTWHISTWGALIRAGMVFESILQWFFYASAGHARVSPSRGEREYSQQKQGLESNLF